MFSDIAKSNTRKFATGFVVVMVLTLVMWGMDWGDAYLSILFNKYDYIFGPLLLKTQPGKIGLATAGEDELREEDATNEDTETATNGHVGVDRYGRCDDGTLPRYGKCKNTDTTSSATGRRKAYRNVRTGAMRMNGGVSGWKNRPFWRNNIAWYKYYKRGG